MRDALASLVFPAPCRICARMLDTGSRIPFCNACVAVLARTLAGPLCSKCGRPIVSSTVAEAGSLPSCHLCRLKTYDFDLARSYGPYSLPMSRAILMLKYGEVTPLGGWFAKHLSRLVELEPKPFAADVLVPVPLDTARLHDR